MNTVGQRISELRNKYGMTQDQLAEKINVNRVTIASYERGAYKPSTTAIEKIAYVFNTTVDYLLGKDDPSAKPPISDDDIKFAVFGDPDVTDEQYEEIKKIARIIRERDKK